MAATLSTIHNIDDEWNSFISTNYVEDDDDDDNDGCLLEQDTCDIMSASISTDFEQLDSVQVPIASNIYISTKSKIAYLNQSIDLKKLFWGIQVIPYATPRNGIIKKQMKFNSLTQEELDEIKEKLKNEQYYDEQIITSINNPNGRIKFKDIRKINVGVSKKDIMSYRCKQKSAFYNCFVMIMRLKIDKTFKEFHIKVFNTGKMEIPGVQNDDIFQEVLNAIISTMQPFIEDPLDYNQKCDTVLINSNFNCGFFINREVLFNLMKFKYNIQCIYDPCSYPGIQSKFYYNPELTVQTGSQISEEEKKIYKNIVEVSFMIFRTGSILIVGMCDENVLYTIYEFLKKMLINEFSKINQKVITPENTPIKDKKRKIRKKSIFVDIVV